MVPILEDHLHQMVPILCGIFGLELTGCKYHFYVILQKAYFKYRVMRAKRKKKAGIDPIRTAFDQMKVYFWQSIYIFFSYNIVMNMFS